MVALAVLEGVVIALLAVLVVGLLRSHAEVLRRLHELGAGVYDAEAPEAAPAEPGSRGVTMDVPLRTKPGVPEPRTVVTPAHDLSGTLPNRGAGVVAVTDVEHTTLIAFLSTGCATCAGFWDAFRAGEADELPGRDTRLVVVTAGPEKESPAAVAALAPPGHTTVLSSAAWDDYAVPVSPYFILVDGPSGRIVGEGAAGSWAQVSKLMREAVADAGITPGGRAEVTPAPSGRLNGRERADRAARDLAAAGIEPGHASLYPQVAPEVAGGAEAPGPTGPADEGVA